MSINFARSKDGKAKKMYELFISLTISCTGFYPKDLCSSCVSYSAYCKVAVLASVELRVCLIHNGDKVGASTVGDIIQENIKVSINPLPEGNDIISKSHKLATHFVYGC